MQLSLSTAWGVWHHDSGKALAREAMSLGFDSIETNFQVDEQMFAELVEIHRSGGLGITSMHNICPKTRELEADKYYFKSYNLSSPDSRIVETFSRLTRMTIDNASELGAGAVVLHLGEVELFRQMQRELERTYRNAVKEAGKFSEALAEQRDSLVELRREAAGPFLERTIQNLRPLVEYAESKGVVLGIENRYYFFEMPGFEETAAILEAIDSPALGFWYDTGHEAHLRNLGLLDAENFGESYSDRMVGVHLHDIHFLHDHLAPGDGELDFRKVAALLKPDTLRVLELGPRVSADRIPHGANHLRETGVI